MGGGGGGGGGGRLGEETGGAKQRHNIISSEYIHMIGTKDYSSLCVQVFEISPN